MSQQLALQEAIPAISREQLEEVRNELQSSNDPLDLKVESEVDSDSAVENEGGQPDVIEVSRRNVSLCLQLNRRTRSMRIVDFRAGPQANKFDLVCEVAEREGIERAFSVVEREEANTWAKMGFEKEGTIPGFYKRSDGYLLGMEMKTFEPHQSGTRIRVSTATAAPASDRGERAYQGARKLVRNRAPATLPRVKAIPARGRDVEKAFINASSSGRAITGLENFGRDVDKTNYLCTARGGFSLLVGVEEQPCFDNTYLEALCAPRGDKETWLTAASFQMICSELKERGVVSVFAMSPVESLELSAAWLAAGFRRTGRLSKHMYVHGQRVDAFLWSCRLGEPA